MLRDHVAALVVALLILLLPVGQASSAETPEIRALRGTVAALTRQARYAEAIQIAEPLARGHRAGELVQASGHFVVVKRWFRHVARR